LVNELQYGCSKTALVLILGLLSSLEILYIFAAISYYAGGGTRTHTPRREPDFESGASTDSATPAREPGLYHGP
jgi:hypothetical protein